MRPDPQAYADVLVVAIKSALAPVVASQTALKEQVAVLERRLQDESHSWAAMRERVAVVEVKAMQPGPPGEPGAPGKDGKDGVAGMTYQGVFVDGKAYEKGDVTTWAGSMWHCNEPTESKPGDGSKAWTLACKHGRDGRDK